MKRKRAEWGLTIVPFDAGFFVSIPCDDPDAISAKLEKEGIFLVPLAKGLRGIRSIDFRGKMPQDPG